MSQDGSGGKQSFPIWGTHPRPAGSPGWPCLLCCSLCSQPPRLCSTRCGLHSFADPGRIMPSAVTLAGTNACSLPAPVRWPHERDLVRSVPAPTSGQGKTTPSRSCKHFLGESQRAETLSPASTPERSQRLAALTDAALSEDRHLQDRQASSSNFVKIK